MVTQIRYWSFLMHKMHAVNMQHCTLLPSCGMSPNSPVSSPIQYQMNIRIATETEVRNLIYPCISLDLILALLQMHSISVHYTFGTASFKCLAFIAEQVPAAFRWSSSGCRRSICDVSIFSLRKEYRYRRRYIGVNRPYWWMRRAFYFFWPKE